MKFTLESSKDFGKTLKRETDSEYRRKRDLYDKFIEQTLKIEMFVPCDDDGNVLTGIPFTLKNESNLQTLQRLSDFEKAKEKVLFEGFEVKGNYLMYYDFIYMMMYELENKTIESIIDEIPNNHLTLTKNAIKQFE